MRAIASALVLAALGPASAGAPAPTQTIQVGSIALEIPASYEYEDDAGTLVAWPRGSEAIVVRVTVQTMLREGRPVPGAGLSIVTKAAAKQGLGLERTGEAVWYHTEEAPGDDSPPGSTIHFWNVGFDAHGLVVSCYIDASVRDEPQASEALAVVSRLIASLRETNRH